MLFSTLAGLPPTITFGGTSLVTTLPAAITEFCPMVTPGQMVALIPIHTLSFITMGLQKSRLAIVGIKIVINRCEADFGCDKHIITDCDAAPIHKGASLIHKEIFAHLNIFAKIHIKRRDNPSATIHLFANDLRK